MATPTRKREESGYIPPGHPSTMAAMERFMALPPDEREARKEEGLALRDAYMEGFGTPPPEDVAFTRPNGTRWAVEQPKNATPASMADLRRMDDAPPPPPPVAAQDWGDSRPGGATMAAAQELDEAGMLGMGPEKRTPRVIRLPEMRIDTAAPAQGAAPAPRRPVVDVSQVGQASPGGLFERLAAAARAPMQPSRQATQGINPEVRAFVENRAAPMDGLQQAQDEERSRRLAEAIWRAGAGINTAISGAKAPEGVDFDIEGPKREFAERQMEDARKTELSRQAALRDPNSPESIRQRAALKAVLPNVPDEVLAGVTAENAGSLFDRLKFGVSEAARRAEAEKEAARYGSEQEYRKGRDTIEDQFKSQQMAASAAERNLRHEEMKERLGLARQDKTDAATAKQGERAERQQADFAKQFGDSGAPGFYAKYDEVKKILDENPNDLPGFGVLAGRLPDAATSAAGVKLRQGIGQMLAEYRKGITGAGMSNAERADFERITGLLESGTEERVRLGVQGLKDAMDQRAQALAAGYRPDVVKAYAARAPSFPAAALQAATASPAQPPVAPVGGNIDLTAPPDVVVGADGKRWKSNGDGTYSPEG